VGGPWMGRNLLLEAEGQLDCSLAQADQITRQMQEAIVAVVPPPATSTATLTPRDGITPDGLPPRIAGSEWSELRW